MGYQANGTLGRIIYDGAKHVKILGEEIEVKAEIDLLNGVSGHADQQGLLDWVAGMGRKPGRIFVNHGEDESCETLARKLTENFGIPAEAPFSGSSFDLLRGEWIRLAMPEPRKKERAASERKQPKKSSEYRELVDAAEDLLRKVRGMEGYANGELRRLTEKIRDLLED